MTHPALLRCPTCGLHQKLCVCAKLPQLVLPIQIIVVQHARELHKPSNTGRLVHKLFKNSILLSYGVKDQTFNTKPLQDSKTDYYVLFPKRSATVVNKKFLKQRKGRKIAFVLLDGTWSQAARMSHRVPYVKDFPFVSFSKNIATQWGVRQAVESSRLCTLEAAIYWVENCYGSQKALPLKRIFKHVRDRHFLTKRRVNPFVSHYKARAV